MVGQAAKRRKGRQGFLVFALFSAILFWVATGLHRRDTGGLRVTFLDVGQGDSCVIESPSGKIIVIDAGNILDEGNDDQGRRVVAPYLRSRGINAIDILVLTHPDTDHIGGAASLLHEFPVTLLLENGQFGKTESAIVSAIFREVKRRNTAIRIARRGQKIALGDGANLTVLAPTDAMMSGTTNDASVVMRLDYGRHSFLLTGDAGETEETELLAANQSLACDVLKAGHHGSKHSTTPAFAIAAKPRYGIFSCGKRNTYGHPNPGVVNRLKAIGAAIYRTDTQGAITFHSDGVTLSAETALSSPVR